MENMNDRHNNNDRQIANGKKGTWDIRPYLAVGLTVILVVFICMLMFFFLFRFQGFSAGISKVVSSIRAVIFGVILAYLLNPGMQFLEKKFSQRLFRGSPEKTPKQKRTIRALAVTCAMLVFLAVVIVLLVLIVPQVVSSVQDLIYSMNDKVAALMNWVEKLSVNDSAYSERIENFIADAANSLRTWMWDKVFGSKGDIISSLTEGVFNIVKTIFSIVVGIIIAVYILMTKERFIGQSKKIIYAVFKPGFGNIIMEIVQKADEVFGGFFIGKIIDSIIIGLICFVGMSIMKLPYVMLISVIVGVTNIIPFFGPYIGAVPSLVLIFLVNPLQALYFLIFIVVLQQVDCNIIGPKILGNSTGLSPFWVIFACLLFGGCFGVLGMIFGVPIFAVIYHIIKRVAEHFLKKKELPYETAAYVKLESVDVQTREIRIQTQENEKKTILHFGKKQPVADEPKSDDTNNNEKES